MNLERLKLENRKNKILARGKYVKSSGVLRKIERQLNNIKGE